MEYGEKQKKVKGNGREDIIKETETVISTSLPTDLNEVLQELPPNQRVIIESAFYAMEKSYTGPLPPPDYCESIEKIFVLNRMPSYKNDLKDSDDDDDEK